MKGSFYKKVRSPRRLRRAWFKVRENGITSKSEETRREIRLFDSAIGSNLDKIYRKLLNKKWEFNPARGVLQTRPHKKPRPIVISPIESRIVQRSILDVLIDEPSIKAFYDTEYSFGGVEGKGVRHAFEKAHQAIQNGAKYFIRTDIRDFFTKIPKERVLSKIAEGITEPEFNELLKESIKVELSNLHKLKGADTMFPLYEIGVAQGCCLSPLMGNILLAAFDTKMNGRGITCLRYIDDFIILAPDFRKLHRAFKSATLILNKFGLDVYDPQVNSEKAKMGQVCDGFEFLGCEYHPGLLSPSRKKRDGLLRSIKDVMNGSKAAMNDPYRSYREKKSLVHTLEYIDNVLSGWGNQYSYCNNYDIMRRLDSEIDILLRDYLRQYVKIKNSPSVSENKANGRYLLGVHLLINSKKNPVIKKEEPGS